MVTVNANNAIAEYNTAGTAQSNNTSSPLSFSTTLAPYADLTVLAGSVAVQPSNLQSGNQVTVQWNDQNIGTGAVNAAFNDYVLVQKINAGNSLTTVASGYVSGNSTLAAGTVSGQQTFTFNLPNGAAGSGNFQVTVTTDAGQTVKEYDSQGNPAYGNNTAATLPFSATLAPYTNLTVANVALQSPVSPQSGGKITIAWDDENIGTAAVNTEFSDSVLIQQIGAGGALTTVVAGAVNGDSTLAGGGTDDQTLTLTLPNGASGFGNMLVTVTTDSGQTVVEYDSNGNPAYGDNSGTGTFTSTLAPYPDLQVGNVSFSPASGVLSGSTVTVNWTDMNTGTAPTPGPWSDRLVVQNMTTGQTLATATLFFDTLANGLLAGGASVSRYYAVKVPDGVAGIGQIQATITTNVFNDFAEYDATGAAVSDNSGSGTFTSTSALYPDLQPTNLQASPITGLQSGGQLTVQWNDTNSGTGPAATAWTDAVVVTNTTTGATLATVNVPYDPTFAGNGSLGSGQSLAQTATVMLPQGNAGAGNLLVTVTVNATNSLFEDNAAHNAQSNNTASITTVSGLAPYPDLATSGVTFSPASPIVGDPAQVTVGWTVTNTGTGPTSFGSWVDNIIYSTNDNPADGTVLESFTHTGDLAVGQSYTQSQTFLLPPAFSGQYHLFVESDATDLVFENGSRANNYAEAGSLFDVTPTSYADLIVSSVTAPATAASGLPMTVAWSVANQGIGTTNSSQWTDDLSLATDPQGQDIVADLGSFVHTGPLSPGGSYMRSGDVTLPNGISGTYYVVVHSSGPYEFIYTNNNTAVSGPITVALTPAPNLTVTSIQTPATAPSGSSIDVTWTVQNLGPGDADGAWPDVVSLQEVGGAGRTIGLGGVTYSATLAAGISYTRTEKFTLPSDFQGVFQAVVTTDPVGLTGASSTK